MTDIATSPSTTPTRSSRLRTVGRWMVTFTGFPLGGFTAELLVGPVNSITAALIGGLITATVSYDTGLGSLIIQGAICGLAVGVAQGIVLRTRFGLLTLAWPPALAAIWAIGWAVTTSIGVQVDRQFSGFGSAGAIVVTALTAVLPLTLNRN